tara:strand:+ start:85 stop:642 length:558 start_codon:yes stop_codon:yes gene_type:complete
MKKLERFKENPFVDDMNINVRRKNIKLSKLGKSNGVDLVNTDTGEHHGSYIGTTKRVDEEQFVKLFISNIALTFDLKAAGIKAFNVLIFVMQNTIEKDKVFIDKYVMEDFNKLYKKKLSRAVLYRGLLELVDCKIIARSVREGEYFINPNFVFNGDRVVFATVIERKKGSSEEKEEDQKRLNDES